MIKYFFIFLTFIHGAIHLMGFAKAFNYAEIKEITCPISKAAGAFWLISTLLFFLTALLFLSDNKYWWIAAAGGAIVSQPLIMSCFKDAKFGTIPNIIIFAAALAAYGVWSFDKEAKDSLDLVLSSAGTGKIRITAENTSALPPSIKKWLERSNLIGKEISKTVYLTQRGSLRTQPDGAWMPVSARQWLVSDKPGFLWKARIEAAPLVHISGCDRYLDGHGRMLIKLMSLFKIADSAGKEIDQGTLLRYMGESVWTPAALMSGYIKFEQLDASSVKAVMNYGGTEASGVYRFNQDGDFLSFEAKRYYERKEGATLEDWLVTAEPGGYKEFSGIRVAAKLAVTWKLKSGDFTWYRLEIDGMDFSREAADYKSAGQ